MRLRFSSRHLVTRTPSSLSQNTGNSGIQLEVCFNQDVKTSLYSCQNCFLGEKIDVKLILQQWQEFLRLATSIKQGTVTASLILRKLASYPRQNSLALALRELGRIERTLFTLDWLLDPALWQRVTAELN
jgi:TnpA family transposase